MGRKIFISYKYGDSNVQKLNNIFDTSVRHYVDEIQELLDDEDHINKGEKDDESLEGFSDSTIASKLRDKIFDSSITLVVISPNMKETFTDEKEQWIPWEISYSLKEVERKDKTSYTNAVFAVVLPDKNKSYNYFIEKKSCCNRSCTVFKTPALFSILEKNMFNKENSYLSTCENDVNFYTGEHSYIHAVKWEDFKRDVNYYIEKAVKINANIKNYDIKYEM